MRLKRSRNRGRIPMRTFVSLAAIAALFLSILSGCAAQNPALREHRGTAIGAGTGGVGGAGGGELPGRPLGGGPRGGEGHRGDHLPRPPVTLRRTGRLAGPFFSRFRYNEGRGIPLSGTRTSIPPSSPAPA